MTRTGLLGLLLALFPVGAAAVAAAPPAAPPAATETTGQLVLVSQPGVEVVWEGVSVGTTDDAGLLVIGGIPAGSYGLVLRRSGYLERSSRIEVAPGEQSLRLELSRPRKPEPEPKLDSQRPPKAAQVSAAAAMPTAEPGPRAPEPASGRTFEPPAASGTSPPVARDPLPAMPLLALDLTPAMRPAPNRDSAAAASHTARPAGRSSALPPAIFLLGFALLAIAGVFGLQRLQRARARAALLAQATPLAFPPPRQLDAEPPPFLSDLQRRELDMEALPDDADARARREAIVVDVEVIDLGPIEDLVEDEA